MLSKLSVKKPYTVIVGIVMVLILGYVAFTSMTADLLPNINLPYAIVYTTYIGASPEEVEETVTKPVESAMATVSNIENVSSTSSENVSMVVLEFSQTTDMDSVSLEMRENLDQISGTWDDSVGDPVIMKLNPDMMPVMIAAVQKDGLEGAKLSDYVNESMLSDIESIEGVASVSTSGEIEEQVDVVIRQEKIDLMNKKIENALNGTFDDAQEELDDAKAEIEDGKEQLESGKQELTDQLSQASAAQAQITAGEAQIETALDALDAGQKQLDAGQKQLDEQKDTAYATAEKAAMDAFYDSDEYKSAAEGKTQIEAGLASAKDGLETLQSSLEDAKKQLSDEQAKGSEANQTVIATLQGTISALETQISSTESAITGLEEQLKQIDTGLTEGETQVKAAAKAAVDEQLASAQATIDANQAKLDAGRKQLNDTKAQLTSGKITLAQAQSQIESAKITATIEMATAQAQLSSGEQQLEQGQEQLDDSKETALEQADLSKKITSDMVSQILQAQNFSMPAGYVTEDNIQYLVRVGDKFEDTENLSDLVLFDMGIDGLEPIKLSDVADVVITDNSDEVYASINGKPGIMLSIQKQTGYSTGEVSDRLKAYFENFKTSEDGADSTIIMDQGIYIDLVINSVLQNMVFGGVLAIIILLLFLRDFRPTLVVACSIPISIFSAIVLMYFSGVTLNIISLSGLALGVGMLVDNSIVVIENIYRLRNKGISAKKAAVAGAKQVSGAIIASTLTTVCVFAPIVFTEGITRQLFVDMGLTIAYSLLASLVIALTLVPMMSAGVLKNTKEKEHKLFDRIQNVYGKIMDKVLHWKPVVLILAVVLLVVSAVGAMSRGTAFMPAMDSTQVTVTLTMPETATLTEVGEMSDELADRLLTISDVTDVGAMAGSSSGTMSMMGGSSAANTSSIYVILSEDTKLTSNQITKEIEDKTKDLDCELDIQTSSMDMSALGGSGISVEIKGKELDKIQELAKEVAKIVEDTEGTTEVSDGIEDTTEELRMVVNKGKASEHNLTIAQIYQQVSAKIAESSKATTLSTVSKDYDVMVYNEEKDEFTREDIKGIMITATDTEGKEEEIPLSDLVDFVDATGLQSISRDAQTRYLTVSSSIDASHNVGLVSDDVKEALKSVEVPEGYSVEMVGEDTTINEAMGQLVKMLALAIVFMYLIMVAQFQSLLSPFIVMFTIPLAFTGGFLGLYLSGSEVSVIAMIGFVMLSGIIVNNGIVLVDYTNQLRRSGMEKREAIIEAGKTRMRPIMMTALTTILGLSTMAMGMGMGAGMVQPMAIVTIGGLIYGTLLTLFVVPCIYDIFNRKKYLAEEENLDEEIEDDGF